MAPLIALVAFLATDARAQDWWESPAEDPVLVDAWGEPLSDTIEEDGFEERLGPDPDCVTPTPRRTGRHRRSCSGARDVACAIWDAPRSDRCRAETYRLPGMEIDYSYFGDVDCRSSARDELVTMIVLHNGDHARNNNYNWQCRESAAHYTIDRDGVIYQHIGEELAAWHAGSVNQRSIGIELQIQRGYGGTCNSLAGNALTRAAAKHGTSEAEIVRELCSPTYEQYASLAVLIDDISGRHPIAEDGVVGHCEVAPAGGHRDPRAFDWEYLGLSNAAKLASLEGANRPCDGYHLTEDTLAGEFLTDEEWDTESWEDETWEDGGDP